MFATIKTNSSFRFLKDTLSITYKILYNFFILEHNVQQVKLNHWQESLATSSRARFNDFQQFDMTYKRGGAICTINFANTASYLINFI